MGLGEGPKWGPSAINRFFPEVDITCWFVNIGVPFSVTDAKMPSVESSEMIRFLSFADLSMHERIVRVVRAVDFVRSQNATAETSQTVTRRFQDVLRGAV